MNIEIYCDGACSPNPGEMGYAAILIAREGNTVKRELVVSAYAEYGTNQIAEIMAVAIGLSALKKQTTVKVLTDSQYVVRTMNGEYKRRINLNYWAVLDKTINQHNHAVTFEWVRGHVGNKYNELAHDAANKAIAQKRGTVAP